MNFVAAAEVAWAEHEASGRSSCRRRSQPTSTRRPTRPACRPERSSASHRRTPRSRRTGSARREGHASTRSWCAEQTVPISTSSFVTVAFATPVIRTVARIELPSTSEAMTCWRFSVDNRFILTIMPERSRKSRVNIGSLRSTMRVDPFFPVGRARTDASGMARPTGIGSNGHNTASAQDLAAVRRRVYNRTSDKLVEQVGNRTHPGLDGKPARNLRFAPRLQGSERCLSTRQAPLPCSSGS